ncbi:MAG: alternative ribosome rescue aminoacyl-tRNA hydrolase ArfB [Myxococcota bacterium]
MARDDLQVNRTLAIPAAELRERASRSSGPGGQHVNKASTRVTLRWNAARSAALSPAQRSRLLARLETRLTRGGDLVVHAGRFRSRERNRQQARERLAGLVRDALAPRRARVATRPGRASRDRRLQAKKRRAGVKRQRGPVCPDEA